MTSHSLQQGRFDEPAKILQASSFLLYRKVIHVRVRAFMKLWRNFFREFSCNSNFLYIPYKHPVAGKQRLQTFTLLIKVYSSVHITVPSLKVLILHDTPGGKRSQVLWSVTLVFTNHQEFINQMVHGKRNLMVQRLKTMHAMKSMVTKTNVPVEEKVFYYIHVANFGARLAILH